MNCTTHTNRINLPAIPLCLWSLGEQTAGHVLKVCLSIGSSGRNAGPLRWFEPPGVPNKRGVFLVRTQEEFQTPIVSIMDKNWRCDLRENTRGRSNLVEPFAAKPSATDRTLLSVNYDSAFMTVKPRADTLHSSESVNCRPWDGSDGRLAHFTLRTEYFKQVWRLI